VVPAGQPEVMTTAATSRPLPVSRLRRRVCAATALVCLPYLTLKTAWILGVPIGSDDASFTATTRGANLVTGALELTAIALAVLMVHPLGRRVPAVVMAMPVWIGTGLLAPISLGAPAGVVLQVATGGGNPFHGDGPLHGWVFATVYAGFVLEGFLLLSGFLLYARDRWPVLFGGRPVDGRGLTGPLQNLLGGFLVAGALGYAVQKVVWAITGSGMYDDPSTAQRVYLIVGAALAGCGAVAYLDLMRGGRLRVPVLLAAWTGSAVVFADGFTETLTTVSVARGDWGNSNLGQGDATAALFILLLAVAGSVGGALRLVEEQRSA
jgi:hypothetical protein